MWPATYFTSWSIFDKKKMENKRMKKLHKMGNFFISLLQSLMI